MEDTEKIVFKMKVDTSRFHESIKRFQDSVQKQVQIIQDNFAVLFTKMGSIPYQDINPFMFNQPNGTWSRYTPDFHKTLSLFQLGQIFKPVATIGKRRINLNRKRFDVETFSNSHIRRCYGS